MHQQYRTKSVEEQGLSTIDREVASQLVERLDQFLAPLLMVLDAYVDKRLVRTVFDLVVSLIQLRHREGADEWQQCHSNKQQSSRCPGCG